MPHCSKTQDTEVYSSASHCSAASLDEKNLLYVGNTADCGGAPKHQVAAQPDELVVLELKFKVPGSIDVSAKNGADSFPKHIEEVAALSIDKQYIFYSSDGALEFNLSKGIKNSAYSSWLEAISVVRKS